MATANKTMSATKVVIPCRISFANIFEPKSINGSEAKYSVSCLIPKTDKKILLAIHKAIEAAKEDGKTRKWSGKIPPNLKMPLRDGDIDRPDDENYQEHFFLNATSKDAPQVVDRHVQPMQSWHPPRSNERFGNQQRRSRRKSRPARHPGPVGISRAGWRPSRRNPVRAFRWSSIPKTDTSWRIFWKRATPSAAVGVWRQDRTLLLPSRRGSSCSKASSRKH